MEEEEPTQFDESFREALRSKGLGEDDIETIMRMLSKHMMGDEMSDEEGEREYAEHGHAHGQQRSRQEMLEHAERETSPRHRREDAEAKRWEFTNSRQNEDRRPTRDRMPRNHLAGDEDSFAAMFGADAMRIGTDMSGSWKRDRENQPLTREERRAAMAMDAPSDAERKQLIEMFGEHYVNIGIQP